MYGRKSTAVKPNMNDMATYGDTGDSLASSTICAPSLITAWSSTANLLPSLMNTRSTSGLAAYLAIRNETPAPTAHDVETSATPTGVPYMTPAAMDVADAAPGMTANEATTTLKSQNISGSVVKKGGMEKGGS